MKLRSFGVEMGSSKLPYRTALAISIPLACALAALACSSGPEGDAHHEAGVTPDALIPDAHPQPDASDAPAGALGGTCTSDADCGPGITCLLSTGTALGAGGPAHGYCSVPCAQADDPACAAFGSKCLDFGAEGSPQTWCVETCTRGGDAPSLDKCHGRRDVACTPMFIQNGQPSTEGYCLPTCASDADCNGRHCDSLSGVCTDSARAGAPTGTHCEPIADGPTGCAGVCLSVGSSTTVCADRCVYLDPNACHLPGKELDAGIGTYSACVFVSAGTGAGDDASCGQLCDTVDDCLDKTDPGVFCDTNPDVLHAYGHGFCNWSESSTGDGGADVDGTELPDAPEGDGRGADDGSPGSDAAPE